jgi:hypothetical protein
MEIDDVKGRRRETGNVLLPVGYAENLCDSGHGDDSGDDDKCQSVACWEKIVARKEGSDRGRRGGIRIGFVVENVD